MKRRKTLLSKFLFLIMLVTLVFGTSTNAKPRFTVKPSIRANPNKSVPLAAIVSFEANELVATTLTVSDGERTWDLVYPVKQDTKAGLPVVGMKYGKTHQITIKITIFIKKAPNPNWQGLFHSLFTYHRLSIIIHIN